MSMSRHEFISEKFFSALATTQLLTQTIIATEPKKKGFSINIMDDTKQVELVKEKTSDEWKSLALEYYDKWYNAEKEILQHWKRIKNLEAERDNLKKAVLNLKKAVLNFKEMVLRLTTRQRTEHEEHELEALLLELDDDDSE